MNITDCGEDRLRTMFEVEVIRKKHINQGWSIRKIARCLGISRTTVRKALKSAQAPRYELAQPRPAPVMDAVADVVMAWIKADEDAPPKQRHTARRIYVRLVEEYGFCGAESTVRCVFRRKPATYSDLIRPPIPIHSGHQLRRQLEKCGGAKVCVDTTAAGAGYGCLCRCCHGLDQGR